MKKALSIFLALALCVGLAVPVLAAEGKAVSAADRLNELGLFNGVGDNADGTPNYDLDRAPNRMEAVTLLVRLLGKEAQAKAGSWTMPFTDVADWAKPYVGYAYENGLTSGTSATTFSGDETVSATQYLTFVLRALGYSSDSDFAWDAAWELTDELGLTDGEYDAASAFTRGDAVIVSAAALNISLKDGSKTLLEAIEEALASVPEVPADDTVLQTFTYSGSAWEEDLYPAPIGYTSATITAKAEVLSKREAVFTIAASDIGEYMWYGVMFKKSWSERVWVNNNTMQVDVTKSDEVIFEFFSMNVTADEPYIYYCNFMSNPVQNMYPEATVTDAEKGANAMTVRVILPENSEIDFEALKDLEFTAYLCTNYS